MIYSITNTNRLNILFVSVYEIIKRTTKNYIVIDLKNNTGVQVKS